MRSATGIGGGDVGQRLAGWLFGARDAAGTMERNGRLAGALFLLASIYAVVVVPAVGAGGQLGPQLGLLAISAISSAVCCLAPWRSLPAWTLHIPTLWWIALLSLGYGAIGGVLDSYVICYALVFLYSGMISRPTVTLQVVGVAEAGLVVATFFGHQRSGVIVIAAAIVVFAGVGQLLALAIFRDRTASELVALARESLEELTMVDSEEGAAHQVASLAARLVGADEAMVLVTEHAGSETFVRRGGYAPQHVAEVRLDLTREQTGLLVVARSGRSLFIADAESSPTPSRRLVTELGVASVLYLPILGEGGTMGVIVAWWNSQRHAIDPFALQLAELLATPVGGVFSRMRHVGRLDAPAMRDPLTGVGNRHRFDIALTDLPVGGTILLFDMDAFAAVNEMFGRQAGDDALRSFADALRRSVRQNDIVTRLGDDTFAVVLPVHVSPIASGIIIERLQRAWRSPQGCRFSVGVAIRADDEAPAETLARADGDLHATKRLKVR